MAAEAAVRVYTIGLGAEVLTERSLFGRRQVRNTELDEEALRAIAATTGARYFRATDVAALRQIASDIDELEPRVGDAAMFRPVTEWFYLPLLLALALSTVQQILARLSILGRPS